jgi:hypothetical protein
MREASLAAITVLTLGTLSSPAMAQDPATTPLWVYFARLECLDVSNDNTWPNPDQDEPYVVIFTADLRGEEAKGRVFVSQVFRGMEAGESVSDFMSIWDLNGNGAPMRGNDNLFLVALMESDSIENSDAIRANLGSFLIPRLTIYRQAGLEVPEIGDQLRRDMESALGSLRATVQDEDDRVGDIFKFFFNGNELRAARAGFPGDLFPEFVGKDSRYRLTFRLQ